jgi:tRNA G18 (ribose-2'-O)-methylase SpoU
MKAILLHNIRSAYNVGSIFRTADGAGLDCVFLSGYTPRPVDRFGRTQPEIAKTSLGASEALEWEDWGDDPLAHLHALTQQGVAVVSVEQDARSVPLAAFTPPASVLYIVGNEVEGVSQSLRDLSDTIVEIPMHGTKESLNVSVAAGIVLFHHR